MFYVEEKGVALHICFHTCKNNNRFSHNAAQFSKSKD